MLSSAMKKTSSKHLSVLVLHSNLCAVVIQPGMQAEPSLGCRGSQFKEVNVQHSTTGIQSKGQGSFQEGETSAFVLTQTGQQEASRGPLQRGCRKDEPQGKLR